MVAANENLSKNFNVSHPSSLWFLYVLFAIDVVVGIMGNWECVQCNKWSIRINLASALLVLPRENELWWLKYMTSSKRWSFDLKQITIVEIITEHQKVFRKL